MRYSSRCGRPRRVRGAAGGDAGAEAENAIDNGARILLDTEVGAIDVSPAARTGVITNRGVISAQHHKRGGHLHRRDSGYGRGRILHHPPAPGHAGHTRQELQGQAGTVRGHHADPTIPRAADLPKRRRGTRCGGRRPSEVPDKEDYARWTPTTASASSWRRASN